MATLQSYSGLKNLNNAWLVRLGIVSAGAVLCALAEYLMGHHFLLTLVALACYFFGIALFVFSGILAIFVALDIDKSARRNDDEDWIQGLSIFCILVIAILMIWVDWKWFAAIAACGSFVGAATQTTPAWWRTLFYAGIGAIVVIQLWLNTALIHLMSSGESLVANSHVETQAPLLAALGFGLATARWVSVRGTNRVAVFLIAFLVFFYGQRLAVDVWAETRSADTQNRAIASLMLANRLANSSDGGQTFLNADNRLEARIKTALLPGKLTLMGFPTEYYKQLQGNDEALLEIGRELLSRESYVKFKPVLDEMKDYYRGYLFTQLAAFTDESVAQQVAREHFPVMAGGEPLTRGAIADKILTEIWEKTPERYRTSNGMGYVLNGNRGRTQLANHLAQYELSMPSRWRYEGYEQFRALLMEVVDSRAAEVRVELNNIGIDTDELAKDVAGTRLMMWGALTHDRIGLILPPPTTMGDDYTYEAYKSDIQAIFKNQEGIFLARGLYKLYSLEEKGAPVKAAIMPMVGILASFVFLLTVQVVVIRKLVIQLINFLYERLSATIILRRSVYVMEHKLKKNPVHYVMYVTWVSLILLQNIVRSKFTTYVVLPNLGLILFALGNEQFLYATTTSALSVLGLEPGFPSFIPDFLL